MSKWAPWFFIGLLCLFAMLKVEAGINLSKMRNHKLSGIIKWKYEKRPFCNAFTGCGKKRTSYDPISSIKRDEVEEKPYPLNSNEIDEELSDLIDINAEPAVENVQKQIMSQAKIYEAIKEASKEIFRQKNKQKLLNLQRLEQEKLQKDEYSNQRNEPLGKIENGEII